MSNLKVSLSPTGKRTIAFNSLIIGAFVSIITFTFATLVAKRVEEDTTQLIKDAFYNGDFDND